MVRDDERASKLRGVEDPALQVREHGEQAPRQHRIGGDAVLRQVALEEEAEVCLPPFAEVSAQGIREAALEPSD